MIKLSIVAFLLVSSVFAGNLSFESGSIRAHTEVFGDSSIDPVFKKAISHLSMGDSITSLKGTMEVSIADFISDNAKRDSNMRETMESDKFPKASFEIKEVLVKGGNNVTLKGVMSIHGVSKPFSFEGSVSEEGSKVQIRVKSSMKMSDYGITPPKMVFLTVRDQVDLNVDVVLKR
ncbi:YceI family protein [Sulfuricurvum sp.]|uniref:YceI family protein n=1 Tax=Sulfuricurvum sp. TaxID=2025608 RepID=UPI0019C3A049|nr:YceI family protein [Sulfuricurvum sp.]MBD3798949.1 YceI family protein [Campylobacterota bacterium]MBD3805687.1 YceI family protein [Sulfuricurvum sp.]